MGVLTLLAVGAADARAQWGRVGGWVGYGSTVQGDILRGEGVFLSGLGSYYYGSAVAGSINADTWMRVSSFVAAAIQADNLSKAAHKRAKLDLNIKSYDDNRKRINNDPNLSDLHKGDALNARLVKLLARISVGCVKRASLFSHRETAFLRGAKDDTPNGALHAPYDLLRPRCTSNPQRDFPSL
jgi:hypothetical protein